jgi:hypothetical protein
MVKLLQRGYEIIPLALLINLCLLELHPGENHFEVILAVSFSLFYLLMDIFPHLPGDIVADAPLFQLVLVLVLTAMW